MSDVLLWALTHGHTSFSQLYVDTGCRQDVLPRAVVDRDEWREREEEEEEEEEEERDESFL